MSLLSDEINSWFVKPRMDSDSNQSRPGSFVQLLQLFLELSTILNTMGFEAMGFETMGSLITRFDLMKSGELLGLTSKTKEQLTEVVQHLDLIEKYIRVPSKETANQLQFLFDRGKTVMSTDFKPENFDKLLGRLRTFLMACCQNSELESEGDRATAESQRNKELQDKVTLLETKIRDVLEWVGEKEFKEAAKINEQRKSETFQEIFRSNNTSIDDEINSTCDGRQSAVFPPATPPEQQLVQENEVLVQEGQELPFPIAESGINGRENGSLENIPVNTPTTMTGVVHRAVSNSGRTMATSGTACPSSTENITRNTVGSNSRLAVNNPIFPNVFFDLDQGNDSDLCSHYKRKCYVKFECCNVKYWPCHRCHNAQSTCGQTTRQARDTKMVKCKYCNEEQQFGQSCSKCGSKFADYVCFLCKHLTGTDDHPYHCEQCGICRIHGNRSFHCDACGICLDVQLRGKHKCRKSSAHDECCICFEDALTGCQILPCFHKVHKECANQVMLSPEGIRCRICSESFVDGRQPLNPRTRTG